MHDQLLNQNIHEALEKVEHPSISATLLDLGMLKNVTVTPGGKATFTLVLPFPNIPDNVRDYLINALGIAAQSAGGELTGVNLDLMNEEESQLFLKVEQENWRG